MAINISNVTVNLDSQIEYYLGLLSQETSKDEWNKEAGKKIKELFNALIEYIIANQRGDVGGKQGAMAQIEQILKAVGDEATLFQKVRDLVKQVQNDPADCNGDLLNMLKELSGELANIENST